ncbi:MAG: hypothetical protein AAF434_13770 [Pseudomonadota bacterium]
MSLKSVLTFIFINPFLWLRKGHPNVVQFLATFVGVGLAAGIAIWEQKHDSFVQTNNALFATHRDCEYSWGQTVDIKDRLREHFGIPISDTDFPLDDQLLSVLEVRSDSEELVKKAVKSRSKLPSLTTYSREAYNGIILPELFLSVLRKDPQIYSQMDESSSDSLLSTLPDIFGYSGAYESFRLRAESIWTIYTREYSIFDSLKGKEKSLNPEMKTLFDANIDSTEEQLASLNIRAIIALENYSQALFNSCMSVQSEWKMRRCGDMTAEEIESEFNADTRSLNLDCGGE